MFCSTCGEWNEAHARLCQRCGQALAAPRPAAAAVGWGGAGAPPPVPPAPPSGLTLVFRGGPQNGDRVECGAVPAITIGRAVENSVVIDHSSVSRAHVRITRTDGRYVVEDLASRNGSWVNGSPVSAPLPLQHGDALRLGDVELQVLLHLPPHAEGPGGPPAHAPSRDGAVRGTPGALAPGALPPGALAPGRVAIDSLVLASGDQVPLVEDEVYVGRAPTNHVVLDDITISRQHARLLHLQQGWLLTDLDSSNGTRVNGQRVSGAVFLHPGDSVEFGRVAATFRHGRPGSAGDRPSGRTLVQRRGEEWVVDQAEQPAPLIVAQPRPGPPLIALQNLTKSYRTSAGDITVLKNVSLSVQPGEFVAIVGPSGCGKSTLLNVITGIDRPDGGQVAIAGQDVLRMGTDTLARWRGRNIGIVFQFFQLLPTLTVAENVMMPMAFCNTYRGGARRARALEVLRLVGMDAMADRLPSALSGGQQQRVAIARALANDPALLVGDEPTGNLDSQTSQQMFALFAQCVAAGKTMLMVTHDPVLARSAPRRVEMLDGAVVQAM